MKKSIALLLILIIAIYSLPLSASAASGDELRYGKTIIAQMNNSAALSYAYDTIVDGIKNSKTRIDLTHATHKVTWDEVQIVYKLLTADYPEFFWISTTYEGSIDTDTGCAVEVRPYYIISGAGLTAAKSKLNTKVNDLTNDLNGRSDYEKSVILHDRVAATVSYVMSGYHQTSYGALVDGKAVCAGYAKAYQLLLHKVGIPSFYVTGESINPATGNPEAHAWNLVRLDGKWYYTDVTWDDQGDTLYYAYLNSTSKDIEEKHIFGDFSAYLPVATATDANYFVKNGLVYSDFDADRLAAAFRQNETIRVYVSGNTQQFEADFKANIRNIMNKMGTPASSGYSFRETTVGREFMLTLNVIEPNHTHSPKKVPKTEASCSSKGNKEYYTCSCGKWFSDSTAKTEIFDHDSVTTPALAHTPSGWKTDNVDHWKECTKCKMETVGTKEHHIDEDHNSRCDVCEEKLIVAGSGTTINTEKPADPKPSESKPTTSKPTTSKPSDTSSSKAEASTEADSSADSQTSDESIDRSDNDSNTKSDNSTVKIIIYAAVLLSIVAALITILIKKKKV